MRRSRLAVAIILLVAVPALGPAAVPETVPDLPILGVETATGSLVRSAAPRVPPTRKTVDGDVSDWTGEITRLGGTAIWSRGEYVYQDYINDAWGADDGFDAERLATLHALKAAEPRTYRADALQQAAGDQFDAPQPAGALVRYGDVNAPHPLRTQADIEEVRVAADREGLFLMVRTLGMEDPASTAILVLLDTEPGGSYARSRDLGGVTTAAEWALLATPTGVWVAAYKDSGRAGGCAGEVCTPLPYPVAVEPSGFANTFEIGIPFDALRADGPVPDAFRIGVAAGIVDDPDTPRALGRVAAGDAVSDLVNVAFRSEPARIWMDERQALALRTGTIDDFLAPVSLHRMTGGYTETFQPRPGYYEAIYEARASDVNREEVSNNYHQGLFQHYGLYLPSSWRPGATTPAMFWMHYRGGHAHDAAAWEPGILREFGDEPGQIVVTPSARGTSSWYTGRGMIDFLDVWDDVFARWPLDRDRVYLGGHSMGGWASNLLGLLFPDRWAAANPQDGLLVPGLWLGAGPLQEAQDGADLDAEFLYPLLGNARTLPYAILHGTFDELVPVSSAIAHGARLHELGYRYRVYLFHAYEHYSAPIWDDWREMVRYMSQFRRDPNPPRVTYTISPALDHAVSTISVPAGVDLGFRFDGAWWVGGLRTRTPGIDPSNLGTIDAITYGRGVPRVVPLPEAGTGGQAEPYTMHGQWWLPNGSDAASNRFAATLTNLATATLDVARMGLGTAEPLTASVATDGRSEILLEGSWPPSVSVEGASSFVWSAKRLRLRFDAAGAYAITIG